jgi:hypothetical protein
VTVFVPPAPTSVPSGLAVTDALLPIHPDRDRLFNELHTRPFPVLEQGSRVSQVALLHGGREVSAEYDHIRILCERYSILPPSSGFVLLLPELSAVLSCAGSVTPSFPPIPSFIVR